MTIKFFKNKNSESNSVTEKPKRKLNNYQTLQRFKHYTKVWVTVSKSSDLLLPSFTIPSEKWIWTPIVTESMTSYISTFMYRFKILTQ